MFIIQYTLTLRVVQSITCGGDVDVESSGHINPPGIDKVQLVVELPVHEVRVDFQEIGPSFGHPIWVVEVLGLVVIREKEIHVGLGDLDISIRIPGHHLNMNVSDF